jgi:hypothetical protein
VIQARSMQVGYLASVNSRATYVVAALPQNQTSVDWVDSFRSDASAVCDGGTLWLCVLFPIVVCVLVVGLAGGIVYLRRRRAARYPHDHVDDLGLFGASASRVPHGNESAPPHAAGVFATASQRSQEAGDYL